MHRLIDTHTHLYDNSFDTDRKAVMQRAAAAGVEKIISVSETMEDARRNLELADQYPALMPAAGLYPAHTDLEAAAQMREFIRANREKLAAIGEVGLDFRIVEDHEQRQIQRQILEAFVDLSLETGLVLNVHSRSAGRHAVELLIDKKAEKVQLHAFDGKFGAAQPAVEAGYFFSIPPSVTRSRQKQKLVRSLPLSCLLVETDSPVLGPDPQTRNEPANAAVALKQIAEIKNISRKAAAAAIYENTRRLYSPWI
ncbi:MAG: TatD family hydrolase [Desulfobacterales bacterium]|nr:TatD family hydrolase [Desulfobacterales bacterium]